MAKQKHVVKQAVFGATLLVLFATVGGAMAQYDRGGYEGGGGYSDRGGYDQGGQDRGGRGSMREPPMMDPMMGPPMGDQGGYGPPMGGPPPGFNVGPMGNNIGNALEMMQEACAEFEISGCGEIDSLFEQYESAQEDFEIASDEKKEECNDYYEDDDTAGLRVCKKELKALEKTFKKSTQSIKKRLSSLQKEFRKQIKAAEKARRAEEKAERDAERKEMEAERKADEAERTKDRPQGGDNFDPSMGPQNGGRRGSPGPGFRQPEGGYDRGSEPQYDSPGPGFQEDGQRGSPGPGFREGASTRPSEPTAAPVEGSAAQPVQ